MEDKNNVLDIDVQEKRKSLMKELNIELSKHKKPIGQIICMGIFLPAGLMFMLIGFILDQTNYDEGYPAWAIFLTIISFLVGFGCLFWMIKIINDNKPINIKVAKIRRELAQLNYASYGKPSSTQNHPNTTPVPTAPKPSPIAVSESGDAIVYKGLNGAQRILDVYEDRVVLTQKQNLRAFITNDLFNGTKEIYYADMTSIQFKVASSFILGYIQFEIPGIRTNNNFGSENSWTYETSEQVKANKAAEYIKGRISAIKKAKSAGGTQTVVQQTSAADEIAKFKSLLDAGVITQEEFDAKKKQLLGL